MTMTMTIMMMMMMSMMMVLSMLMMAMTTERMLDKIVRILFMMVTVSMIKSAPLPSVDVEGDDDHRRLCGTLHLLSACYQVPGKSR